ncbi:MAG: hypothetical protein O6853_02255, partial [Actinobacteria bacterium]|nr:hypothetical protein [Actinomycetota bacterium]
PNVTLPLLFFLGTKDALSRRERFDEHIGQLPNAEVEVLDGAGHSPKGGGWTYESTVERLVERTSAWIARISSGRSNRQKP